MVVVCLVNTVITVVIVTSVDNVVHEDNVDFVNNVVSVYNVTHVYKVLVDATTAASCVYIVAIGLILYN
ncbi:MAG: hypothetical protein II866_01550 [Prevotella sp.]|nr:hypothetical protein [Prevotella sp.]